MFDNIIIFIAAACGAGAVLALAIKFMLRLQDSAAEEIKQFENKTVDAIPRLPLQNEGAFGTKPINNAVIIKTEGIKSPSELLKQLSSVNDGIITVNEARIKAGLEPFNEFQKVAHDFGETKTPPKAENKHITIRTARICQNCGSNVFEPAKSIFSMTCAYCGTKYDTNKNMFDN